MNLPLFLYKGHNKDFSDYEYYYIIYIIQTETLKLLMLVNSPTIILII